MAMAPAEVQKNPKSELVMFLQRFIGRSLTKEDVQYALVTIGEQFQATVRLACHNMEEYVGEVCTNDKEAMMSAAQQALDAYHAEIAALPPAKNKSQKQKEKKMQQQIPDYGTGLAAMNQAPGIAGEEQNYKTILVQTLQTHCKRAMTRSDVAYETVKVGDLFQSTVTLHCVQGMAFVGEPATCEKVAEHNAAEQAMIGQGQWAPASPATQLPMKRKNADAVNPKSELVIFLQGYTKKTLQKADIVYTHVTNGNLMQATVTLNVLEGQAFAGEPCPTQKAAENSAAEQALKAYAAHLPQIKALQKLAGGGATGQSPNFGGFPPAKRHQAAGLPNLQLQAGTPRNFTGVIPPRGSSINTGGVRPPALQFHQPQFHQPAFQVRPGMPSNLAPMLSAAMLMGGRIA